MFTRLFTIFFLFAFAFAVAQQDADPNPTNNHYNPPIEAMWDVLFQADVTVVSGAAGNAGAEWDGTSFYTARWASNLIHEYTSTGTLVREFSITGVTGLRDLAYDGTYFYGGAAANTIYQMDFTTNTLIGTIPSPVAVRHIAYDEGMDAFWVGNWSTDIVLVSRTGTTLATIPANPLVTSNYGSAYDNVSAGGPYLWVFSQGTGAGTPQFIHQLSLPTGTVTGVSHDVLTDVGVGGALSIAGGLFSMTDFASGFFTIGGLLQGNPIGDQLFVYEIEATGGFSYFPYSEDFDGFTVGTNQVACQDPVNWTTWSNAPCGADDADISSNFSNTAPNSALILQNDDLVKPLGGQTSGVYYISFNMYIPSGKSGYFNTMSEFFGTPQYWVHETYFDVGGVGRLLTEDATVTQFTWIPDTWNFVQVKVDLNTDQGQFMFNGNLVHTWPWTSGTSTGTGPLKLDVNDFFGATANDEMYIDNYWFNDFPVPVELTSFSATSVNGTVQLNWATATELNNQMFEIERKAEGSEFYKIGFVSGHGTTTEPQQYSYTDNDLTPGTYYYRLKQIDFQGTYQYSPVVEVDVTAPLVYALEQNYPNPFNPSTLIRFSIAEPSFVKLTIYNTLGEEIKVLKNEFMQAGFYEESFNAAGLSSGVYFYSIETPQFNTTKKMILTK